MEIRKAIGRPTVVSYRTIEKLSDAISHNATITEATAYAEISRDTYYRHLGNKVFAEKMTIAKSNQNKVVFTFQTFR